MSPKSILDRTGSPLNWRGPTIHEIAAASGVGTATVDRVLNGRDGVRETTRLRVLEAIETLSKPEQPAPQQKRRSIAVLTDSGSSFNKTLQDAVEKLRPLNPDYDVAFNSVTTSEVKPIQLAQMIERTAETADGIVLVAREEMMISRAVRSVTARGIPVICLTTDLPGSNRTAYVGSDQVNAGSCAAYLMGRTLKHLTGNILLVVSATFRSQAEREMGVRSVLRAEFGNLKVDERVNSADDFNTSYTNLRRYIADHGAPLGIYNVAAGNLGIAEALKDEGLKGKVMFIGHELNSNSRMLLETGGMDYVISHDFDSEAAMAVDMLRKFFGGTQAADTGKTPVQIYTKYNCR